MNKSENINELAAALHKCQGIMGGVVKNSSNPFFKSNYADLTAVLKAAKPVWHDNGITVIQHPCSGDRGVGVTTLVMHSSGQWIEHEYVLPIVKADPQAAGSAITYARRYALQALALMPALDDDAEFSMARDQVDEYGKKILTDQERIKIIKSVQKSIDMIKEAIERDDDLEVRQLLQELTNEEKEAIWIAPSKFKYAPFTTQERAYIQTMKRED